MDLNAAFLRAMLRQTLVDPRAAARALIATAVPMEARWLALAVVVVLSALLGQIGVLMIAGGQAALMFAGGASVVVQGILLLMTVYATHVVGRVFGGVGSFADALLLISWVQFLMVVLQGVQLVAMLLVPPLAGIIAIVSIVMFLWVLTNFVTELHGFESLGKVFGMILITFMALAFVMAFVLALLGIQGPGVVDA